MSEARSNADGAAGGGAVLSGVRVADFTHALAGPLCSMILGDLGADVVKIERPTGDQVRHWGPPFHDGDAAYYFAANRNKRSISLDLKDPEDLAVARALIERSEIVVENSRPGVMARAGLDYESLRPSRPDLIYCSITAFGGSAPPKLTGYDLIVQALSGIMSVTGATGGEPTKVGIPIVDQLAGLYATVGVLAAVIERERSGEGQLVEVSLLPCALAALSNRAAAHLLSGEEQHALGNAHPNVAPYELYSGFDRRFVLAAPSEALWERVCTVLDRRDLTADRRFATNAARVATRAELQAEIERTTQQRPATEWVAKLTGAGVPAALVNTVADAFSFAEGLGLAPIEHAHGRGGGSVALVRSPISLSRNHAGRSSAPPSLDQHGTELRRELKVAVGRSR